MRPGGLSGFGNFELSFRDLWEKKDFVAAGLACLERLTDVFTAIFHTMKECFV
ncbi:MAG: hypothetical protein WAK57_03330 [Desulfobacterales bacterium]